jgi:hypothetical protein
LIGAAGAVMSRTEFADKSRWFSLVLDMATVFLHYYFAQLVGLEVYSSFINGDSIIIIKFRFPKSNPAVRLHYQEADVLFQDDASYPSDEARISATRTATAFWDAYLGFALFQ